MLQIESKYKVCKRLGAGVFEQCQTARYALSEARAQKSKGRRRAPSDYSRQLTEKQKVRYTYGLSEKQFSRYVKEATHAAEPMAALYKTLEMRLDNTAYRLGLAPTRRAARQMVSHGHILVNGKRMTVPSHQVRVGDTLAVREGSKGTALFAVAEDQVIRPNPSWATFDRAALAGSVTGVPAHKPGEDLLDFQVVFEYYSR
jgi:small subunit ribosomal protein S4